MRAALSDSRCAGAALVALLLIFAWTGTTLAEDPQTDDWHPESDYQGKFDWIQMTSGEWVKGEIIAMYDDDLEFDSDEFDDLVLGWGDIKQIHSSQVMNVGFLGQRSAVGKLVVIGDKVLVIGDDGTQEFAKSDVLTITAGPPKEINFWAMKLFFGVIVRTGNSDVREVNLQANFKRRTIKNRITMDFIANQNTTESIEIANNQRASVAWDKFMTDRLFVKPVFGEYFRDPFQNIAARYTLGVGAGYQIIDSPKVDWEISGGPAYQETNFETVDIPPNSESTPALVVGTTADWDITNWLEFDGTYRLQVVNEESGTYNHHMVLSFETEITSLIDFDISWIWDRIEDPRADENGIVPQQDDFRTTVGLTFEW
jgi:putative salt-induced outer membrane protein YdiY